MGLLRSMLAVLAGIIANVALATGLDYALCTTVFPEMATDHAPGWQLTIALGYRTLIGVGGGWLTARLAPSRPITHALVLGAIGFVVAIAGVIAMWNVGQQWYPILLAIFTLPSSWLGGKLATLRRTPAAG